MYKVKSKTKLKSNQIIKRGSKLNQNSRHSFFQWDQVRNQVNQNKARNHKKIYLKFDIFA